MTQSVDTGSGKDSEVDVTKVTKVDEKQFKETDEKSYDADFSFLNPDATGSESSSVSETEGTDGKEIKDDKKPEPETNQEVRSDDKEVKVVETKSEDDKHASYEVRFKGLQSSTDKKISELNTSLQEKDRQIAELKKVETAVEEFKKNQIGFLTRYAPEVAAKLDPRKIVLDKLHEEFKTDIENGEIFRPEEMYQEGTFSYRFRGRETELLSEISLQKQQAISERESQTRVQSQAYLVTKTKVMKERNLTDEQYQKEIVEFGKTLSIPEAIAKIRYYDDDLKKAVTQAIKDLGKGRNSGAKGPVSASSAGGDNGEIPDHLKEMQEEFGD